MNRRIAIILHSVYIGVFLVFLCQDYQRVGHFQWVDPGAIEDNEEFFFIPFTVVCLFAGICSVFYLIWGFKHTSRRVVLYLLRPVSFMYAVFCTVMGILFFILVSAIAVTGYFSTAKEFIIFLLLLLSTIGYVSTGILTFNLTGNK
jgi:hypothetical protein